MRTLAASIWCTLWRTVACRLYGASYVVLLCVVCMVHATVVCMAAPDVGSPHEVSSTNTGMHTFWPDELKMTSVVFK